MTFKKEYRLYALKVDRKSIEAAMRERFNRITPDYILVYTDGKQPEHSIIMEEDDSKRLNDADVRWLLDCNVVIIAEEMKRREPELSEKISERIDALEAALRAEKEKMMKEEKPDG